MLHGSKIVFYVEPATTTRHGATYAINSDGGGKTRIRVGSFATLSPDGSKTVYDRSPRNADLYVANLDGSAETRLTRTKAPDAAPAWSPDGSRIAFVEVHPSRTRSREISTLSVPTEASPPALPRT
jgi:dipeptidyl aminopeptidase/acylaminoacyl peptidase